jgi:uroporphyrinogen-III synthase
VLIVRGNDMDVESPAPSTGTGRDWLAQHLQTAGASAHFVVAYERRPPVWTAEQMAQARHAATDGSVWCFSSSQAIRHLRQAMPAQNWAQARCITTHARIAQTAQALGFGEVHACRPSVTDVLISLESLA